MGGVGIDLQASNGALDDNYPVTIRVLHRYDG
jgi:hypothetical protein